MTNPPNLDLKAKREILHRVLEALSDKFYQPAKLGAGWQEAVARYRSEIENAETAAAFEDAITRLLGELKTSHVGFFHAAARRASSRAALSATYLEDDTDGGARWIFQDVHEGGAAAQAQINPGDILLRVAQKEIHPPEHPTFAMGDRTEITVLGGDGEMRTTSLNVARPKGKKLRFVEPTLVVGRRMEGGIGYLKVAMFPGMIGVEVANAISEEIQRLDDVDELVIDLRGNTGGGIGALRIMSLLTPDKLPVGFALNRELTQRNIEGTKAGFPRFNRIHPLRGISGCSLYDMRLRC